MQDQKRQLEQQMDQAGRLPPGQSLTLKFPVLHRGSVPEADLHNWTLRTFGLVEEEQVWDWGEFLALPKKEIICDIHCVTRWSKFGTTWEGLSFQKLAEMAGVKAEAKFVIADCEQGYTTNRPLNVMLEADVLLAHRYNGEFLSLEHGFPLRTLVPSRYLWKSAKWVRAIEFSAEDRPGFWETGGYHNEGDPWLEQRFRSHP